MANRKKKMSQEQMREHIHSFRGIFKRKPGEKPFAEEWAEYKRQEKELEERKFQRLDVKASNPTKILEIYLTQCSLNPS